MISGKVIATHDYGTHTLFVAEVTEAKILSDVPSVTYQDYFDHIKPKPAPPARKDRLGLQNLRLCVRRRGAAPGFICPLCKHGAEDFERLC